VQRQLMLGITYRCTGTAGLILLVQP